MKAIILTLLCLACVSLAGCATTTEKEDSITDLVAALNALRAGGDE